MSSSSKNYKYPIIADNFYELFGLTPFSDFSESKLRDAYHDRYQYWKFISQAELMADKSAAMDELINARRTLSTQEKKERYDTLLRQRIESQLEKILKPMLKVTYDFGISLGLTSKEIVQLTNRYIKNLD